MKRRKGFLWIAVCVLAMAYGVTPAASQQGTSTPPAAKLALDLTRGICIDRQFRVIPPEDIMRFTREDIRLIKSMGFSFVKVLVNPEPLMLNGHLDAAKTWYLREMVECVVGEGLPVVVCIHPEWEYKKAVLAEPARFEQFLVFLDEIAHFLAASWGPKQLALQLMTEPVTNGADWNDLQPRMWRVARKAMPDHALILAGDQVGTIDGLIATKPVDDANVIYSFTYYDPFVLTLQGGEWLTPKLWSHLGGVPYPSSPEIIAAHKRAILDKIPADPPDWRPAAEGMLNEYGEARWSKEKIATYVQKLADWNAANGGGLKIWCAEFGCYQRTIAPDDRVRFIRDVREAFESRGIGWAYWSYNEVFTIMAPGGTPFGPAIEQTPDTKMLDALFGK